MIDRKIAEAAVAAFILALGSARANDESLESIVPAVKIPEFSNLAGRVVSFRDVARDARAVVFAWTSAECPMAKVYRPRIARLASEFATKGVRFFLVDSSSQDSLEQVRELAKGLPKELVPVRDVGAGLATALSAKRTTEVVLFDARGNVRYRGAVDDQYGFREDAGIVGTYRKDAPTRRFLEQALTALLSDKPIEPSITPALGCAIGFAWPEGTARPEAARSSAVTFHEHVEPLLQRHCQDCHHGGGSAPFPLVEYDDVAGWATTIGEVVASGRMPPWNADPKYGKFSNDRSLPKQDQSTVLRWLEGGAPRGDPARAPEPRTWSDGWRLGEPDVVLEVPAFEVPAEGRLPYRYVSIETGLTEDRWIRAAQLRSTGQEVVHHVLTFLDPGPRPRGAKRPWAPRFNPLSLLQGSKPGDRGKWVFRNRSYLPQMRGSTAGGLNGYFVAGLPGAEVIDYRPDRGKLLPANSKIRFQLHYTPNGTAVESKTRLGLWFLDEAPEQALDVRAASTVVFEIPPGEASYEVRAAFNFPRDATLLSLRPHMHLRGKSFRYIAEYPDGRKETLLHVPRYDFDWQLEYVLSAPKHIPRGTKLRAIGVFDNSESNPYNPDPSQTVYFGLQSEEEMFIGYFEAIWKQ